MRNKLKLVVNNKFKKKEKFFVKNELRSILNLYAKKFLLEIGKIMDFQLIKKKYHLIYIKEHLKNLFIEYQKILVPKEKMKNFIF